MCTLCPIVLSCDPQFKEGEVVHGGGERKKWSGFHRGGLFLSWGVYQLEGDGESGWASQFSICFDTGGETERQVEFQLVSHNGDHELVMQYNGACGELTEKEVELIHSLMTELDADWHWESNPRRPQCLSRSSDTARACVIVARATDWFLDRNND